MKIYKDRSVGVIEKFLIIMVYWWVNDFELIYFC